MTKLTAVKTSGPQAAIIIFGLDENERPHASWFPEDEADLAEKAAGIMKMRALRVTTHAHRAAALELAAGRLFPSGKAFVPFTKATAYERLCAFGEAFDPPPVDPIGVEPIIPISNVPANWEDIGIGSLVLATVEPATGWFESIVVATQGDDLWTLLWRDWPEEPSFERRSEHLALIAPTHA